MPPILPKMRDQVLSSTPVYALIQYHNFLAPKKNQLVPPEINSSLPLQNSSLHSKLRCAAKMNVLWLFREVAPVLVVENVGFRSLTDHLEPRYSLPGRKYSETALPKL